MSPTHSDHRIFCNYNDKNQVDDDDDDDDEDFEKGDLANQKQDEKVGSAVSAVEVVPEEFASSSFGDENGEEEQGESLSDTEDNDGNKKKSDKVFFQNLTTAFQAATCNKDDDNDEEEKEVGAPMVVGTRKSVRFAEPLLLEEQETTTTSASSPFFTQAQRERYWYDQETIDSFQKLAALESQKAFLHKADDGNTTTRAKTKTRIILQAFMACSSDTANRNRGQQKRQDLLLQQHREALTRMYSDSGSSDDRITSISQSHDAAFKKNRSATTTTRNNTVVVIGLENHALRQFVGIPRDCVNSF